MGSPKKVEGFNQYPFLVNLNLDEFMISKPMNYNLDELVIKNVISAKECNMMQNPSSSSSSSSSPLIFHGNPNIITSGALANNTIDDVWNDIVNQKQMKNPLPPAEMNTTEEFTLEEYLIRTGAIRNQEDFLQNPVPLMAKIDQQNMIRNWQQQEVVVPMQVQAIVGSDFQVSDNGFENKIMGLGYLEEQPKMTVPTIQAVEMAEKSSDSKAEPDKMRVFKDEGMAKTAERRHRRMIKNRESAARSRARKQVS